MKMHRIIQRVVKQISQEYNIPEEDVWGAVREMIEKNSKI